MDQKTILKIIKRLNKLYDVETRRDVEEIFKSENIKINPKDFHDPFKSLVMCVLSQNTSDKNSTKAYIGLLKKFKKINLKILSRVKVREIKEAIKPGGLYNIKAKRIKQLSKIILEKYKGKVPDTREELLKLPGVGYKTADVVLCYGYGRPVIPVDTHVNTISKRLGIADEKDDLETVREKLHSIVPENKRAIVNHLFVEFGKEICQTRLPLCYKCPIVSLCPYEDKNL